MSLADAMSAVSGIFRLLASRRDTVKERPWEQVLLAVDAIESLTALHVKAINEVVKPILISDDIRLTHEFYWMLLNDSQFLTAYDSIDVVLEEARRVFLDKNRAVYELLVAIGKELTIFKFAVFFRLASSRHMQHEFEHAVQLWSLLSPRPRRVGVKTAELQEAVYEGFTASLKAMQDYRKERVSTNISKIRTQNDVVCLVREWCKQWQQWVQQTLYGRHGVNFLIGQLRQEHLVQLSDSKRLRR